VMNNDSAEIIRMLSGEVDGVAGGNVVFYPPPVRG